MLGMLTASRPGDKTFSIELFVLRAFGKNELCIFGKSLLSIRRIDTRRRTHGKLLLHLCYFSAISRSCRHAKLSIQRFLPLFPPIIAAEKLHFALFVKQKG